LGLFVIIIPVQGKSEEGETGHFDHLCAKWKVPCIPQATHGMQNETDTSCRVMMKWVLY